MSMWNKIKMVVGILMVFLLILATNLIDKDNFAKVEDAVENMYQDELLTKERVLELSILMHEKEIALIKDDTAYFEMENEAVNDRINILIEGCNESAESKKEKEALEDLEHNCILLFNIERDTSNLELIYQQLELVHYDIKHLSEVQVEEGRIEKIKSRDAVASARLFARIEIYLLIALALIIQFIVLYRPRKKSIHD
jgi:hypothetical protein